MHWIYLALAIVFEVVATSALKAAATSPRPVTVAIVVVGYLAAFGFLALSLKALPVGVAYAIWGALGMVLIAVAGWVAFGERLDAAAVAGIGLIIAGVILIGGFSDSAGPS